jgi:hypothetical protein
MGLAGTWQGSMTPRPVVVLGWWWTGGGAAVGPAVA